MSIVPVFTLEAQEGKLFGPLAFTKTYLMAAAAGLSVTLIPVLMCYFFGVPADSSAGARLSGILSNGVDYVDQGFLIGAGRLVQLILVAHEQPRPNQRADAA